MQACEAESSRIGGPMLCIGPDRESRRGSALTLLTQKRLLSPSSPIYPLLAKLRLFNLLVGDNDVTADKDPNHVIKRCQNLVLRLSRVLVDDFLITTALLRFYLKEAGLSSHHIDYLLNPTNQQDVPLCYTLLKEIWSLKDPKPTDKPGFIKARCALKLLGELFPHLVIPFIQITLSLHEQLGHLSAAAHLATYLYTVNNARNKAIQSLTVAAANL